MRISIIYKHLWRKMLQLKRCENLKSSNVKSWVISLKRSSLNPENTFRSLTKMSTAFARSRLQNFQGNEKVLRDISTTQLANILSEGNAKNMELTYPKLRDTFAFGFQRKFSWSICYPQPWKTQIDTSPLRPTHRSSPIPQNNAC